MLVDDTTSVFQSQFGVGLTQRVTRIGPRWKLNASFERLSQQDRHNLMSFLSEVRGKALSIMYTPRHSTLRGSFPASELFTNNVFDTTTGWLITTGAGMTVDGNRIRMTRTNSVNGSSLYQSGGHAVTNGAAYLLRAALVAKTTMVWDLRLGVSAGDSTWGTSGNQTALAHRHASGVATATTGYATLTSLTGTGVDTGEWGVYDGVSLARCIRVNGASQTGNQLDVKNLPTSTNGLLVRGDIVSIYTTQWELKRVTAALNSDSSGLGVLQFESSLRASPSDSAPIAVHAPSAKFILTKDGSLSTRPGMYSDFDLEFTEIIEP